MVYRPFYSLGRYVLAACAVTLGAGSLGAQTAPSTPAPAGPTLLVLMFSLDTRTSARTDS